MAPSIGSAPSISRASAGAWVTAVGEFLRRVAKLYRNSSRALTGS